MEFTDAQSDLSSSSTLVTDSTADLTFDSHQSVPFAVALIFLAVFGLIFTLVIIVAYTASPALRNPQNFFMTNLAMADFILLLTSIPPIYVAMTSTDGREFYSPPYCDVYAFVICSSAFTSMSFMGAIGFTRFVSICYPKYKSKFFTWVKCSFAVAGIWLYNVAFVTPALTGWGRFTYSGKMHLCGFDFVYNFTYNIIIIVFTYVIVCVIVFLCYLKIFMAFRNSKKKVGHTGDKPGAGTSRVKKDEFKLAIQLLVIFAIYNLTWGPIMMLLFAIDPYGKLSVHVYEASVFLMYLNSFVNGPLYMYFNKVFRMEVLRIFFGVKLQGGGASSTSTTTTE